MLSAFVQTQGRGARKAIVTASSPPPGDSAAAGAEDSAGAEDRDSVISEPSPLSERLRIQYTPVQQAMNLSSSFMEIANQQMEQDKAHREQDRVLREREMKLRQDEATASRESSNGFMTALLALVQGNQVGAPGAPANPVCQMDQNQVRDTAHNGTDQIPHNWLVTTVCVGCQHKACMHRPPPLP
jgi:hypothetical protein